MRAHQFHFGFRSSGFLRISDFGLCGFLLACFVAITAHAQTRPYIGFAYPAGGQQGTSFEIKLGGQGFEDIQEITVSGPGVSIRILDYYRVIGPQETTLLNEQLRELKRSKKELASNNMMDSGAPMMASSAPMMADSSMMVASASKTSLPITKATPTEALIAKIDKRLAEYCNRPASAALAALVFAQVTVASNAPPGQRELRVVTTRGVSNPMVFHVGQLPETCRKPMLTANYQVLGKEELALRRRATNEVEVRINLPCTVNGQVASGERNRYRFSAKKGQHLVISALARQLIPYIADAVPGWFQPVLALYDSNGKEVAYDDDYRFKPDPTILYEVPKDGEYTFVVYDSIFRGREDFVYRITAGEVPFITSIYPLGGNTGSPAKIKAKGWNIGDVEVTPPPADASAGTYYVGLKKDGLFSNRVPFALDTLPDIMEKEPNNPQARAQRIQLPAIINGRIDWADDTDVYCFQGRAGEVVAAEVFARRLESPVDSVLRLTDARGKLLALNDDREDPGSGVNTHHADSYFMAKLPSNGVYYVHIGDMGRSSGEEYSYRLRISAPQPDFALRVVPSSISMKASNSATVAVYAMRKDGFTNTIRLSLKDPPAGFTSAPIALTGTQAMTRLTVKTTLRQTPEPITLTVMGTAKVKDREITHEAVPAEDRMQAFLWRHLVPAAELKTLVYDPALDPAPKRIAPVVAVHTNAVAAVTNSAQLAAGSTNAPAKPKFSKAQVSGRLRQLKFLYEEGLLTDAFYTDKVAECEAAR